MAKSDNNNTFGDFSKKINLDPSRKNLKPVDPKLTFEQYLSIAIAEGHAMLAAEDKTPVKHEPAKTPSPVLQDALAKMSDNPYIRARIEVLNKMTPKARAAIEEMERIGNTCNSTYDKFAKAVTTRGDQLSTSN